MNLAKEKKTGISYALKLYEKYKLNVDVHRRKNLRREIAIMNKLDHGLNDLILFSLVMD